MSDLLNKASLVVIPSGYKEDTVYSVVPSDGSGDLSFTRASNGTRVNSAGLVEVCPWNFLLNTDTFSSWSLEGGTLTSGQTDPNGGTTAYKYQNASIGPGLWATLNLPIMSSGLDKTQTIWVKSVSGSNVNFVIGSGYTSAGSVTKTATSQWQLITNTFAFADGGSLYINTISDATNGIYVWHPQLNIGSTAKPYFPTTDRLNVPRLTYQNGGGGCPSLLLEKQSTNLQTYSEDFTQWTASSATVTANNTTSPDGTQNADRVQFTGAGYLLGTSQGSGNVYTLSCWAKRNGSGTQSVGFFKDGSGVVDSAWALTSDWQRFTYTYTASNGSYSGIAGVNGVDVFVWGAQFEQSSYPTSYIPTTSASATRVADACYKTGISSLIGQTSGTILWDLQVDQLLSSENILNIDNGSFGDTIYFLKSTAGSILIDVWASGVQQSVLSYSLPSVGRYKIAFAYANNDFALYINGVARGTDSSGSVPPTSRLQMGNGALGPSDGKVNELVLFKTRLTNAELASLTTI